MLIKWLKNLFCRVEKNILLTWGNVGHLHHLYPFMDVETIVPQEVITSLQDNNVAGTTAPGPRAAAAETQDEFSNTEQ